MKIEEFRKYLTIDRSSLDEEVMRQPSLLFEVSEAVVTATAKRDALKEQLAQTEAMVDQQTRNRFEANKLKFTEAQIKSTVLLDSDRTLTNDEYLAAKTEADLLIALKEAFQTKGYMLRDLASLYNANYFANDSVRETQSVSDAVYTKRRARLAEGRKKRGE